MSLRALAEAAGIDCEYVSWRGEPVSASDEAIRRALIALQPDLQIDVTAPDAIERLRERRWTELVPPAIVAWDGELEVPLRVRADLDGEWRLDVALEAGGGVASASGRLFDLPADSHAHPGGLVHCIRRARVSLGANALGYHELQWRMGEATGTALVIAAPTRAYGAPGSFGKRWGVFAPVYGLASPQSGQAGDLGTLRRVFEAVSARGGSYVATLPILAAFLERKGSVSPYSPASRLFWNELYLDLPRFAEALELPIPAAPRGPFATWIDYPAQAAWRRPIIDRLAGAFFADPSRTAPVHAWAGQNGVFDYAAFRAIGEAQGAGWHAWPAELQNGTKLARTRDDAVALAARGGARADQVDMHVFAQWAMRNQLLALRGLPAALYVDLPVGVNSDAYEVWRWRRLFLGDLAAGAPPDALFLGGQDWGLPPMSPIALRRGRFKYFIDCVRLHMQVAGMLRIDHVMGLFRLYCVPNGLAAKDGVYIRYPANELLAILTLESHRAKCAIAGEDLGTVPDHVRPAMQTHGFYRLHVGQWAFPKTAGQPSALAPAGSVASLNTHDMPTFAGWWNGADITDMRDLELVDDANAAAQRVERAQSKAALLALAPPSPLPDVERAMLAATTELAEGPADVVLVALDDLVLEPVPHNVPGTTYQRPNWQRRIPDWDIALDEQKAPPAASAAITAVAAARPRR